MSLLKDLLQERILVLDGGMGSMIQQYNLAEADYRGTIFAHLPSVLQGNSEALNLARPDIIQAIHQQYLDAGADIIETNTLNATSISMADYGMESFVRELNIAAVRIAREVADTCTRANPDKPRFVAGSIGPTNKTASLSPDVSDPAFRNITFDELHAAYREQIDALIDAGVDALLIETSFDTLNVKAVLMAAEEAMLFKGKTVDLMISYTLAGKSGRILSGQTLEAAMASVAHAPLLSIGLNCSFGAKDMKPFLKMLGDIAPCYISAYPNAGLPNSLGQYDETPETMAVQIQEYLNEGLVNIIGGCCGTTPPHIAAIAQLVRQNPAKRHIIPPADATPTLRLAGLDVLNIKPFTPIGERCNVAGSRKFLRLIQEKNYDEALQIARKQVVDGAQILDINVDDGLLDGVREITRFLNLIASEPDIAQAPIMVDSSDWNIIEAGLKCLQGKSIVNSISLKNGEEDFLQKARRVRSFGAAVIAMAFDEQGQADTFERKIEVCGRMYRLLTEQAGFLPQNIIFDPNILAIGTGIEAHNSYAVDFIRAVEWIKRHLPEAKVSGGVSNLSFSFRGNNYLREAIHAVFLHYAIEKGMDMGIVNPSTLIDYTSIPQPLRTAIEDLVFNRRPDATEQLLSLAQTATATARPATETPDQWRSLPLADRLRHALLHGIDSYLEADLREALDAYPEPVTIIDQPLMEGMNAVGQLFGEGKMFLPQVVKTARTMKKAVAFLEPYIEASRSANAAKAGKVLIATVKGDVHDIGKNITGVILSCNNYEVIDLGVMVPPEQILQQAIEHQVDIIALSGLITPSLQEMAFVASEMEKAGFTKPLLVGGATTSPLHTALKIAPLYRGAVLHATDASKAIPSLNQLLNPDKQAAYIETLRARQQELRDHSKIKKELVSLEYARAHAPQIDHLHYRNPTPKTLGNRILNPLPINEVAALVDWGAFLAAWKLPVRYARYAPDAQVPENEVDKFREALQLMADGRQILRQWIEAGADFLKAIIGFYPVRIADECLLVENEKIPLLRQQEKRDDDVYRSLADFIRPEGDHIGLFVVTAGEKTYPVPAAPSPSDDPYREMLEQILKDRLAEAATEYVHRQVCENYWGYASAAKDVRDNSPQGIRPASGYPSLPDLSLNFTIDNLLEMKNIGVTPTPNGALYPNATTAGIFIAHPAANYFYIGAIAADQLADYAEKKGYSPEEVRKWLGGD
jgi:5-methyltetrahydrofolate--homocysteine methyltransferase